MKLVQLTDDQMIIFEKTGKVTKENLFYDSCTDFLYISIKPKCSHEYFTNRLDIKNKITLFYENNTVNDDLNNLTNQLENWNINNGLNEQSDFLGNCSKRYNGLQIRDLSTLININWKLPFIEVHEFPYIDEQNQCLYIIINFSDEDPFNYTEEDYEKINNDIGILWSENNRIKQITIRTNY